MEDDYEGFVQFLKNKKEEDETKLKAQQEWLDHIQGVEGSGN